MSWFSFTDIAKNALSEAQKKIDKALDIQAHERENKGETTVAGLKGSTVESEPTTLEQPQPTKKTDFASRKRNKPKPGGPFGAKKLSSSDVDQDFFSILNDVNDKVPSKKPATKSPSTESFTEVLLSAPKEDVTCLPEDSRPGQVEDSSQEQQSTTFITEYNADTVTDHIPVTSSSLDSSYSEVSLTVSSEATLISEPDTVSDRLEVLEPEPEELKPLEIKSEASDSSAQNNCETDQEGIARPVVSEEVDAGTDRTVSPTVSTAASSEIDILDHESTTSEVSSKFNDGPNLLQSPLHIPSNDAMDSDASQALSPTPGDRDGDPVTLASSPPRISDEKPLHSLHSPVANHTLQMTTHTSNTASQPSGQENESLHTLPCSKQEPNASLEQRPSENAELAETSSEHISNPDDESKYMVLSEKMEIYEQQLLNLSRKNALLNEENDNLRSEVERTKEFCEKEAGNKMKHLSDAAKACENNNKLLKEEKSNLNKQIAILKSQLASRMTNEQVQNAIAEKEESIKGLMEEGEVLAKKHLQQNNLIKKLKTQAQEREAELKSVKEKLSKFEEDNRSMKGELQLLRGQGEEEREASLRISDAYEQRERQTVLLQEKLSEAEEKQRTLQVNLDAAYKEIGELHKQKAEVESKSKTEWIEREEELRRENDIEIKKILSEQEHQRQLLMLQMYELNNSITRSEAVVGRKEDEHRRELRELQQQLQESEARNQELSDGVSSATRPLLRQIENLQATHASQQRSWNAVEKTYNNRMGEAQAELLAAQENERLAQATAMEAKSKALVLEKTMDSDKRMISQQEQEIDSLRMQVSNLKEETVSQSEEIRTMKETHKDSVEKSRKERLSLENQLQMEKVRLEAERKKYLTQQENLQKERDRMMWSRSEITSVSSNLVAETESVGSGSDAFHSSDLLEKQLSTSSLPGLASRASFDSSRTLSMSNVLENLQTQLKLRDGEIAQLRGEINMLERTRSSMAEEIVRLTNLNEDMDGVSKEMEEVKNKLVEVEGRYTAILTMYGEKEEENEELKMDLEDVKAMYKQQINDLLRPGPF